MDIRVFDKAIWHSSNEVIQYNRVYNVETTADIVRSSKEVHTAQLPVCIFDLLMLRAFEAWGRNGQGYLLFLVCQCWPEWWQITKISPKWKPYGIQTHLAEDETVKPAIHAVASIRPGMLWCHDLRNIEIHYVPLCRCCKLFGIIWERMNLVSTYLKWQVMPTIIM